MTKPVFDNHQQEIDAAIQADGDLRLVDHAGEGAESADEMDAPVERECWDCGSKFMKRPSQPLLKGGMCTRCYVQDKL